jgi:prevent-host-death family protein
MIRVGVRDLRENLLKYLERVKAGERLEVTQRGRPVALLLPVERDEDPMARLEARRLIVRRATRMVDDLPAPLDPTPGQSISEMLDEQRRDRL